MFMLHPKIDKRSKKDLVEQMKEIVPYYTPEWRFNPSDPDLGSALFLIFADMFSKNIERFNRAPLKHFIAFLNLFDVSLKTPQPATTYTTFFLSPGTKQDVFVPKGTKLSANHEDSEVIFETANHLLITPAIITDAFKVSAKPDVIINVSPSLFSNEKKTSHEETAFCEMFNLSQGENLQEHCFYISHEDMFNLTSTVKIELELTHPLKRYKEHEIAEALSNDVYVEWSYYHQGSWHPFDYVNCTDNKIVLHKTKVASIDESETNMILGKWLKCNLRDVHSEERLTIYSQLELGHIRVKTNYDDIDGTGGFLPDLLFADELHLSLEEHGSFYPFGEYFGLYNSFYLSSQEAFSKKGSLVSIHFTMVMETFSVKHSTEQVIDWKLIMKESQFKTTAPQNLSIFKVAWEYWNGQTWVLLPLDKEYEEIFHRISEEKIDVSLTFSCPFDIAETSVNSEENYWIRARVLSIDNIYANDVIYYSPKIENIRLLYESENNYQSVQQCVTYNNLEYENQLHCVKSEGLFFRPFSTIHSTATSFYLGFDEPPVNGPISLFFNFHDANFTELDKPFIEWQYLREKGNELEWMPLKVVDHTQSFTKSGECRFSGNHDFAKQSLFSKQRYWIRIVNRNDLLNNGHVPSPKLKGLHLNTIKVVQQEEILNENPVVISNHLDKTYQLINYPVLSEEVWVDERMHISEEQIEKLLNEKREQINIIRDSEQNIIRCWIKWKRVSHFLESRDSDRHYMINRSEGKIMFGNGKNGKKPPNSESDDILVNYKIGGGTKGNIARFEMTNLQSAIPFVQSVTNYEPAGGGSNLEELEAALKRGPLLIKHRNRAVTAEDFEALVREASQNIAKVKCLSNYNSQIEKEVGAVTIVVLPESGVEGLQVFPELKERIEKYLLSNCANTIAFPEKIQVIKPAFLEVSLTITLVVENMDMIVETEMEAFRKIQEFLNPLTGNENGNGWEIGQRIHLSVFYSFLKSIRHVLFVEKLYMSVYKIEHGERTEINVTEATHIPHGIVINGKHQVHVKTL